MKSTLLIAVFQILIFIFSDLLINAQSWEELASLDNPTPFPVMAASNGKIYLLSGTQGTVAKTFEYDPAENKWTEKSPVPSGCIYASAVEVNGKIYVMGGGQNNVKKDFHYIYDPVNDSISEGAALLTPRMYHNSAAANGKIYLIGGQNGDGTTEWYFDEYEPLTNTWTRKEQSPHNQAWYCGAAGVGTKFFRIAGGRWNLPTDYFDAYDSETEQWEVLPPFPITLHAPSAVNFQNKIIISGGYNNEHKIDSIYTYYPSTSSWILSFNHLPEPMAYHKSAVIGDYVYIYNKDDESQKGKLWRFKFGTSDVDMKNSCDFNNINIYPNPCSGDCYIYMTGISEYSCEIEIFNQLGMQVYKKNLVIESDYIKLSLDYYYSGIYFVKINVNGNIITRTLIFN